MQAGETQEDFMGFTVKNGSFFVNGLRLMLGHEPNMTS